MSDTSAIRFKPRKDESVREECQCARCGSSVTYQRCERCGGDGEIAAECSDPGSFRVDWGFVKCPDCNDRPMWQQCLSDEKWCEANPLPGRASIERGKVEWFDLPSADIP